MALAGRPPRAAGPWPERARAPVKAAAAYPSPFLGAQSAADPGGTVFLAPAGDTATLANVVVLAGDGEAPLDIAVAVS